MRPLNFLAVEDDEVDMMSIIRAFKSLNIGNTISRAVDGLAAWDILSNKKQIDETRFPDVILLDLNMPRMNGIELLKKLSTLANRQDFKIYVLTTSDSTQDINNTHEYGISGYILKKDLLGGLREAFSHLDQRRIVTT